MDISTSEVPIVKSPRKIEEKKYHVVDNLPPEIAEMKAKYELTKWNTSNPLTTIPEEDFDKILDLYADSALNVDIYTIAECFNCSMSGFNNLIQKDGFKEKWESAKRKRGARAIVEGFKTASIPFDLAQQGFEISNALVASAKLKSNYLKFYGQSLNKDFAVNQPQDSGQSGNIQVIVNTGLKLNI